MPPKRQAPTSDGGEAKKVKSAASTSAASSNTSDIQTNDLMNQLSIVKKILTEALEILCGNLEPTVMLRVLKTKGVLRCDDIEHFKRDDTTTQKVERLLDILKTKPVKSYELFMDVLESERSDLYALVRDIESKHNYIPLKAGDNKQHETKAVQTTVKDFGKGMPNAKFNRLCISVIKYIDRQQDDMVLQNLKMLCMVESDDSDMFGIPMGKMKELTNGIQFVAYLRQCQLFSPENILYMQYLLHEIEADQHLLDEIATYGESCKNNPLRMLVPSDTSAQGIAHIKCHLKGKLYKFTHMKADEFLDVMSEKLDIPRYLITITGIDEGSIKITLQIPKRWNRIDVIARLKQQIHPPETWMIGNNMYEIKDIEILYKSDRPSSTKCSPLHTRLAKIQLDSDQQCQPPVEIQPAARANQLRIVNTESTSEFVAMSPKRKARTTSDEGNTRNVTSDAAPSVSATSTADVSAGSTSASRIFLV